MSNLTQGLIKQAEEYSQFLQDFHTARNDAINDLITTGLNKSAAVKLVDSEMSMQAIDPCINMLTFAQAAFEKVAEEINRLERSSPEKSLIIQGLSKEANLNKEDINTLNNLSIDALIKVSGIKDPSEAWHMGEVSSGPNANSDADFAFQQYCLS